MTCLYPNCLWTSSSEYISMQFMYMTLQVVIQSCKSAVQLEQSYPRSRLLVFVTGNTIYMVGRRIASQMVAQDARNKMQRFRQVRALGRR